MMFHYFGFHYVTCPQPLDLPCAFGTFKKPVSSIGPVGSLVRLIHSNIAIETFLRFTSHLSQTDKCTIKPAIVSCDHNSLHVLNSKRFQAWPALTNNVNRFVFHEMDDFAKRGG